MYAVSVDTAALLVNDKIHRRKGKGEELHGYVATNENINDFVLEIKNMTDNYNKDILLNLFLILYTKNMENEIHCTCGCVEISKKNAKLIVLDSLGEHDWQEFLCLMEAYKKQFPDNKIYLNSGDLQKSGAGCLYFSLNSMQQASNQSLFFSNKMSLFNYAENKVYPSAFLKKEAEEQEEKYKDLFADILLFDLPPRMMLSLQSISELDEFSKKEGVKESIVNRKKQTFSESMEKNKKFSTNQKILEKYFKRYNDFIRIISQNSMSDIKQKIDSAKLVGFKEFVKLQTLESSNTLKK